jgi:hypothetical protein
MLTIQTRTGPATVDPVWAGAHLAVHAPYSATGKPAARGRWTVTHTGSGLSAGTFHGPKPEAIRLAKLWDAAFSSVTAAGVRSWQLRDQWTALIQRRAPIQPPLHGPSPSPNAHPGRPEAVCIAQDAGRRVRYMAGLWEMSWRGRWWELPTLEDLKLWTIDSCCETPDGRTVEPDSPDSWLRLLCLV